jgi:IS5 family transposase
MQLFYNLSDPAMEDALYEIESMRRFAGLRLSDTLPDETTILNFRHLLERHGLGKKLFDVVNRHLAQQGLMLREGSIVDATIISAPSSTKNESGEHDLNIANKLLHGKAARVWADAGYVGIDKREETQGRKVDWLIAMRPGKRAQLPPSSPLAQAEKAKASVRAKVEHPFRFIKQVFGYSKVRYRGLEKNTNRLHLLAAFTNLMIGRKYLLT